MGMGLSGRTLLVESGRFRGVTPLSRPALEGGNPDTSAGRCSPTLRRAPEFVSAGEDVLHAGSIPSVASSPSVCSRLDWLPTRRNRKRSFPRCDSVPHNWARIPGYARGRYVSPRRLSKVSERSHPCSRRLLRPNPFPGSAAHLTLETHCRATDTT